MPGNVLNRLYVPKQRCAPQWGWRCRVKRCGQNNNYIYMLARRCRTSCQKRILGSSHADFWTRWVDDIPRHSGNECACDAAKQVGILNGEEEGKRCNATCRSQSKPLGLCVLQVASAPWGRKGAVADQILNMLGRCNTIAHAMPKQTQSGEPPIRFLDMYGRHTHSAPQCIQQGKGYRRNVASGL